MLIFPGEAFFHSWFMYLQILFMSGQSRHDKLQIGPHESARSSDVTWTWTLRVCGGDISHFSSTLRWHDSIWTQGTEKNLQGCFASQQSVDRPAGKWKAVCKCWPRITFLACFLVHVLPFFKFLIFPLFFFLLTTLSTSFNLNNLSSCLTDSSSNMMPEIHTRAHIHFRLHSNAV